MRVLENVFVCVCGGGGVKGGKGGGYSHFNELLFQRKLNRHNISDNFFFYLWYLRLTISAMLKLHKHVLSTLQAR